MNKIKLNLGSGVYLKKGFINVDKYFTLEQAKSKKGVFKGAIIEKGAEFVQADIGKMPFPDNYADYIEMHQVIEHFPMRQVITYMREIYRVMKKGAKLVLSTPSFSGAAASWLYMIANPPFNEKEYIDLAEIIYGNQVTEGEAHKCPFTQEFLNYVLVNSGFKDGTIYVARKGTKISLIKCFNNPYLLHKDAVFRNDNIIAEVTK